jgi:hypothetical protein
VTTESTHSEWAWIFHEKGLTCRRITRRLHACADCENFGETYPVPVRSAGADSTGYGSPSPCIDRFRHTERIDPGKSVTSYIMEHSGTGWQAKDDQVGSMSKTRQQPAAIGGSTEPMVLELRRAKRGRPLIDRHTPSASWLLPSARRT